MQIFWHKRKFDSNLLTAQNLAWAWIASPFPLTVMPLLLEVKLQCCVFVCIWQCHLKLLSTELLFSVNSSWVDFPIAKRLVFDFLALFIYFFIDCSYDIGSGESRIEELGELYFYFPSLLFPTLFSSFPSFLSFSFLSSRPHWICLFLTISENMQPKLLTIAALDHSSVSASFLRELETCDH